MCQVSFRRVAEDEARVYAGAEHVGEVYRQPDVLREGAVLYIVHLEDDPRGWCRVHDRHRLREVCAERIRTHPFRC